MKISKEILYKSKVLQESICKEMNTAYSEIERMDALLPADHVIINSCFNPVQRPKNKNVSPKDIHDMHTSALRTAGIHEFEIVSCVEYTEHTDDDCLNLETPHLHVLIAIPEAQIDLFYEVDRILNRRFGRTSCLSAKMRTLQGSAIYNTEQIEAQRKQGIDPIYFYESRKNIEVQRSPKELLLRWGLPHLNELIDPRFLAPQKNPQPIYNSTSSLIKLWINCYYFKIILFFDDS